MDSFEFTKILGALLFAGLVASLSGFITGLIYPEREVEARAYVVVPGEEVSQEAAAEPAAPEAMDLAALLAAADPEAGQDVLKKCRTCHNVDKGGKHKIGPNLWDVVNRPVASADGYAYSNALQGMSGETWSYENLDAFLHKPKEWAAGTKMSFAGLRDAEQRADLIAFLRSLSDSPAALPQ